MRPIARLVIALLAIFATGAASIAARSTRASDAPLAAGEIRVRVRPGGSYARMEGESVAVMRLLRCTPAARPEHGRSNRAHAAASTVARNDVGDQLEIPVGGGPEGMTVEITRRPGMPFRSVEATADAAVTRAILTLDATGCETTPDTRIVLWSGGNQWDDVGGTFNGSAVIAELPHLSVYALAGN
jgi:hypothetical protein